MIYFRISGLDPAGPNFFPPIQEKPLNPRDGHFVDTIQSDNFFIGTPVPLGHVSFFPNNGTVQPGCAPVKLNNFFDFITRKLLMQGMITKTHKFFFSLVQSSKCSSLFYRHIKSKI